MADIRQHRETQTGFTLLELLVVIAIIAVVLAVTLPNMLGARQRASDAKKKAELAEFKNALNMYYADYQSYPAQYGSLHTQIVGCGTSGTTLCPDSTTCSTIAFQAGGSTCNTTTVYMKKFPTGFSGAPNNVKYYSSSTNDFCLVTDLDNGTDPDIATSQTKCASSCGANCTGGKRYCMCAD